MPHHGAEAEIVAPAPHIRSQFRYRRLHADALARRVISRPFVLNRLTAIARATVVSVVKVKPRNVRSCWLVGSSGDIAATRADRSRTG
jgi:hypothetical protein